MKRSSLVGHTVELLDIYRSGRQPADAVLRQYQRARGYLGARDRRTISEWYYETLRNFTLLELLTSQALRLAGSTIPAGTIPSAAILSAVFVRIFHEDATPLRPDLVPSWKATKWGVELDQFLAALMSVQLPAEILGDPVLRLAAEQSFPEFIVAEWVQEFGPDETEQLCITLNRPAPTTIRVNTIRGTREECREVLKNEGIEAEPTQLSPVGLRFPKRVDVNTLRTFRDGWFEVQDEGSQLVTLLLEVAPGKVIVDACAGGGGKTLHIGALLAHAGCIIAIDSDERRLAEISPRVERAGVRNLRILHAVRDANAIGELTAAADGVLIDAPCSGVGTFRRNPGSKTRVTPAWIEELAAIQRSLLERYASLVKPGGRIVYSTCTLIRKENEECAWAFVARRPEFTLLHAGPILVKQGIRIAEDSAFLKLLPHRTGTDGFFAAVFERTR